MDVVFNFRMMARYNQRMNQQLIAVCHQLSYQQMHQDTKAFFPTVMAHWNHILFGDLIMLQRLVASGLVNIDRVKLAELPIAKAVDDTFVSSLQELETIRTLVDSIYLDITEAMSVASCDEIVRYTTTEGELIERKVGEFLQHIFNHQTHHRGQLTCLLSQFGLDFGSTDLPVIVPEGWG